jgi:hypothetical protein
MRYAHSLFGDRYNRINSRSGKVAEDRPKTPRVQNTEHEKRVHFYIEANPIRAGIRKLENLQDFRYSTYGFYAFGKKTKFTHLITVPKWYLELGKTAAERQRKYRKLFRNYLESTSLSNGSIFLKTYIGDPFWIKEVILQIKVIIQGLKPNLHQEFSGENPVNTG